MGRPLGSKNRISSLQKFAQYHEVDEATGCWNWLKSISNRGYAEFNQDGHKHAHRWAYATFRAPIPNGMHVLHSCDNRRCVNPDHLFLGTNHDNILDMAAKGRQWLQNPDNRSRAPIWFRPGNTIRRGTKFSPERRIKHSEAMRAAWVTRRRNALWH